jgi:Ca-activated chloride channel family protein
VFVLAALVSLGVSRLLGFGRRKKNNITEGNTISEGNDTAGTGGQLKALTAFLLSGLVCLLSLLNSSCSEMQGKLLIMEGNFYTNRGLYTDAISAYLKSMDYEDAIPYAEYGLGSAYFALEEGSAALERYAEAEKSLAAALGEHPELRYRLRYNSGIIHFEKGEYEEAAASFREALEIDGSRIEAKRNLELSLLTLEQVSSPQEAAAAETPQSGAEGENSGSEVLFDYLRQREQEQWKSKEWEEEDSPTGPDY